MVRRLDVKDYLSAVCCSGCFLAALAGLAWLAVKGLDAFQAFIVRHDAGVFALVSVLVLLALALAAE